MIKRRNNQCYTLSGEGRVILRAEAVAILIANEVKQSHRDCFVAYAPRNDRKRGHTASEAKQSYK